MALKIDLQADRPIYLQIVQRIKHQIASGELQPGQQLPTLRGLAQQLHVHSNTVARAYDLLDQQGVISTQQGRGTYIAHRPDAAHLQRHQREVLLGLFDHIVLEALSLGYTSAEIKAAFAESSKRWSRKTQRL